MVHKTFKGDVAAVGRGFQMMLLPIRQRTAVMSAIDWLLIQAGGAAGAHAGAMAGDDGFAVAQISLPTTNTFLDARGSRQGAPLPEVFCLEQRVRLATPAALN